MDLFLSKCEVTVILLFFSLLSWAYCEILKSNSSKTFLMIQEPTLSSLHTFKKYFFNETTKLFVTKNNRHEYDFLYSDPNCEFIPKGQVSASREVQLGNILATFDSEDGGMLINTRKRKKDMHDPTLPEDLFDSDCELIQQSDKEVERVAQESNDAIPKKEIKNKVRSEQSIQISNDEEENDLLQSDFNVQPILKTPINKAGKVYNVNNILDNFDSDFGRFIPERKKSIERQHEPTLPNFLMDREMHVSAISGSDGEINTNFKVNKEDKSVKLSEEYGDDEFSHSDFNVQPRVKEGRNQTDKVDDLNKVLNNFDSDFFGFVPMRKESIKKPSIPDVLLANDIHVSRMSQSDEIYSKTKYHRGANDDERGSDMTIELSENSKKSSSNENQKKKKWLVVNDEKFWDKLEINERKIKSTPIPTEQNKPGGINLEWNSMVDNFLADQKKHTHNIVRPITHILNESIQESYEKYTTSKVRRVRKKSTKHMKTKKVMEKVAKHRGRPRKTTTLSKTVDIPTTAVLHVGSKRKKTGRKICSPQIGTNSTQRQEFLKLNITLKKSYETDMVAINNQKIYKNNTSFSIKHITFKYKQNFRQTEGSMKDHFIQSQDKFTKLNCRNKNSDLKTTRTVLTTCKIKRTAVQITTAIIETEPSEFSEESIFTVVPILDSEINNNLDECRITKRKKTTLALKTFKNYQEKFLHLKEVCGNDGLVDITRNRTRRKDFSFKPNEEHFSFGNITHHNTLNETSLEVEAIPIIDFKDPYRILEHKKRQSQYSPNFKIGSWNVNGIRAWAQKGGFSFLKQHNLDIFCVQEVRCPLDKIPKSPSGYHAYWFPGSRQGYAGVAVLSKVKPKSVSQGFVEDGLCDGMVGDGRVLTVEYEQFYLVNVYAPASKQDLSTLSVKLKWNSLLHDHLRIYNKLKPVVLAGDFNVAHEHLDLALPLTNLGRSGFTKLERDGFSKFLSLGFIDSYRHLYPQHRAYSYWPYYDRPGKLNGWRLDYFLLSDKIKGKLCDQEIHCDVDGSDHAPQILYLNL